MGDPAYAAFCAEHPGLAARERFVDLARLRLHLVEAGPEDGPPVLLLHGFPEFWWGWRRQLPALAAAGYRAVAPDLPGYNLSDKPRGLAPYGLDALADRLAELLDALALPRVALVGHDWGGVFAWRAALRVPARVARLAILNAPHPAVFRRALRSDAEQRRRSRYVLYFQLPFLPERKLAAGGFRPLRSIFRRTSPPGTFSEAELERYAAAAARPRALAGMLAWYRAALWRPPRRAVPRLVEPPVLLVWGTGDAALGDELAALSAGRCRACELVRVPEAGHWVQHAAAEAVNRHLLAFLAGERVGSPAS